jgi:hypothetical protein
MKERKHFITQTSTRNRVPSSKRKLEKCRYKESPPTKKTSPKKKKKEKKTPNKERKNSQNIQRK